jgi:hypothetical protein
MPELQARDFHREVASADATTATINVSAVIAAKSLALGEACSARSVPGTEQAKRVSARPYDGGDRGPHQSSVLVGAVEGPKVAQQRGSPGDHGQA